MATYNGAAVTDAVIASQKPITLQQGRALRDNPIAIAEGAAGAPRLEIPALGALTAGTTVRAANPNTFTEPGPGIEMPDVTVDVANFAFLQSGTIRVAFEHESPVVGSSSVVRVNTSGVETVLQTWAGTGAFIARSVDCAVVRGEELIVRHVVPSGFVSGSVRSIEFRTGGEWLWPGAKVLGVYLQ